MRFTDFSNADLFQVAFARGQNFDGADFSTAWLNQMVLNALCDDCVFSGTRFIDTCVSLGRTRRDARLL